MSYSWTESTMGCDWNNASGNILQIVNAGFPPEGTITVRLSDNASFKLSSFTYITLWGINETVIITPNGGSAENHAVLGFDIGCGAGNGHLITPSANFENITSFTISATTGSNPNDRGYTFDNFLIESPLPVELTSFNAEIENGSVKLSWATATELNNYGFEIERALTRFSITGETGEWNKIAFVEGYGNSNSPKYYEFIDAEAPIGQIEYRLKQIDTDGKFEYSKVVEVDLGSPMNYELSQNYPNPFNPSTTIRFTVIQKGFVKLLIFNFLGEKIEELVNEVKDPGVYSLEFDAKSLPSGIYFYKLQASNFNKSKKMILLR